MCQCGEEVSQDNVEEHSFGCRFFIDDINEIIFRLYAFKHDEQTQEQKLRMGTPKNIESLLRQFIREIPDLQALRALNVKDAR